MLSFYVEEKVMGIYQQPTDKFECFMCKRLQTDSCPVCNKQTNEKISLGKMSLTQKEFKDWLEKESWRIKIKSPFNK